jgi:hypothetical protein
MSTPLNVGSLPQGFCPTTYQDMLAGFGAALSVSIPATSGFTISTTKPSITTNVWFRVDSLNRFIGVYLFGQGAWLSAHPLVPGLCQWYFSGLPDFNTFDGSDSGSIGPASGPMWQQAKDGNGTLIAAKFIVSAGTLPSTAVLSLGGVGGEEQHTLIAAELTLHNHFIINTDTVPTSAPVGPTSINFLAENYTGGTGANCYTLNASTTQPTVGLSSTVGQNNPHNNMPPYVVGYLLQRTARFFYAVN